MKRRWIIVVSLTVAVIAYLALAFLNVRAGIEALIALIGSGGLLSALWEVAKANLEHRYRLDELDAGNAFVLGATSHMAEVAFNKHVEFCEKYVLKVREAVGVLMREGPSSNALSFSIQLSKIREDFTLWETPDVTVFLLKFEKSLTSIGANEIYLKELRAGPERTKVVTLIYDEFKKVMALEKLPDGSDPDVAVTYILQPHENRKPSRNLRSSLVTGSGR